MTASSNYATGERDAIREALRPRLNATGMKLLRDTAEAMFAIGDRRSATVLTLLLEWHDRAADVLAQFPDTDPKRLGA
jgi:hypothetical protein